MFQPNNTSHKAEWRNRSKNLDVLFPMKPDIRHSYKNMKQYHSSQFIFTFEYTVNF